MYANTPLRQRTTRQAANIPGLLQGYYTGIKRAMAMKAAWDRVDTNDPSYTDDDFALYNYINGTYEPGEITDLWAATDEAAATITGWDTDHAELLAL